MLASNGYRVIVPDLSGFGELSGGQKGMNGLVIEDVPLSIWFASVLTGKCHVGIRLEEIERIIRFVRQKEAAVGQVSIVTTGVLSSDALHAAVLFDDDIDALALIDPLVSYKSLIENREYQTKLISSSVAGAVEAYDLPQLVKALRHKKILMINPVKGDGVLAGAKEMEEIYSRQAGTGKTGSADNLSILYFERDQNYFDTILDWLR